MGWGWVYNLWNSFDSGGAILASRYYRGDWPRIYRYNIFYYRKDISSLRKK
jgi:hypothetical protein